MLSFIVKIVVLMYFLLYSPFDIRYDEHFLYSGANLENGSILLFCSIWNA